ncbi:nonsense-mediated mRNA decay factor SMG7-like [Aristolochia californica]|uniref:nonsense-mediated mRNA decay factor SMG7-like n=1 Tax=Aristolochia californica TaxID=171875 RepID=UPI0035DB59E9
MMIVPMDNSSARSAPDLVQRLFDKNVELETGLRMAARSKIPSDPSAWLQMRENYETIILKDNDFSEKHEIEYALWQLHYRRIEEFRAHINASASSSSSAHDAGRGVSSRLDRIKNTRSVFKSFLSEATGSYHDLILKIRAKYGLLLGYFSDSPENGITLAKDAKKTAEMKKGLLSCHRCLIYLGDLARYKGLYGEGGDSALRDFAAASSYYIEAATLWPSSGNPHHQLAILSSYSGDDLVAVYRYFRSLAVDSPFSTARDNLIITFEKNRQAFSQLPIVKTTPLRVSGRGRGRHEAKHLAKANKIEPDPVKEKMSVVQETYKTFCIQFVRLNGILFTKTSLETFDEIFSVVLANLDVLLSSGPEEELNFGVDAGESALFIVRVIAIIIFTVHNVNRESEGQSYVEILQRSVLLQNAVTAGFEFVGHIINRCIQLQDVPSSCLLPGILVFVEWLASHSDIVSGPDIIEEKQARAMSFFWKQCVAIFNKLVSSGLVSVNGDGEESCFVDMSLYDDGESENLVALWEDFELRGFLPLRPAHLILDFSRKYCFESGGSNKEKRARAARILTAGRALVNVVCVDQQSIYFDQKQKIFYIGFEPQRNEDDMIATADDVIPPNGMLGQEIVLVEKTRAVVPQSPKVEERVEEEEEEVIVFKPLRADNQSDLSLSKSLAWTGNCHAVPSASSGSPVLQPPPALLTATQLPTSFADVIPQALPNVADLATSKWLSEHQLLDGLENLTILGNGHVSSNRSEFMEFPKSSAVPLTFSVPVSLSGSGVLSSGPNEVSEALSASRINSAAMMTKIPLDMPAISRRSPVSQPVARHYGPPPGFNPLPQKLLCEPFSSSILRNDLHPTVDDYTWLDGYQYPENKTIKPNVGFGYKDSNYHQSASSVNSDIIGSAMNFPFPGKLVPCLQSDLVEGQRGWQNIQQLEHLKLLKEQQLRQGSEQTSTTWSDQYQGQPLWSDQFFV